MKCIVEYVFSGEQSRFANSIERYAADRLTIEEDINWLTAQNKHSALYLSEGRLKLMIVHPGGEEKALAWFEAGCFLPFSSALSCGERIDSSFVFRPVETPCSVLGFPEKEYCCLLQEEPLLGRSILDSYGRLIRTLSYEISRLTFEKSIDQMIQFLYHYYCACGENVLCCTQEIISEFLGIDRTNTAKILSLLRKEGVVETGRCQVVLTDVERLRELHDNGYERVANSRGEDSTSFVDFSTDRSTGR